MIDSLVQWDTDLFFWLNGLHTSWLDPVMELISTRWFWIPFYLWILAVIFRQKGWKYGLAFFLIWILMIGLSDQIASGLLKPLIGRIRPCRPEADLERIVHTVNGYCGGKYSFASSHAANFFAMATYLASIFGRKTYSWIFFTVAACVAYSRIYLGVHFPGDILAGLVIGISAGILALWVFRQIRKKWFSENHLAT